MPDDNRPHFEIPQERVRNSPIPVRGRAKPFARPNYSVHADFLRERTATLRAYAEEVADAEATESVFLQVRTPVGLPAANEKPRLRSAGLEVVAVSPVDVNSATVQLKKDRLQQFEAKVEAYGTTPQHRGKSYLSIIDDLGPVPPEKKLDAELLAAPDQPVDCLLVFYSTLTEREQAAVLFSVHSFMERHGGQIGERRRLSNGVTVVEARLKPSEAREVGAAFSTLRQVSPDHVFYLPDSWKISSIAPTIAVNPPRLDTAVAVIDTGISATCPGLAGTVASVQPRLPSGAVGPWPEHGTFVASRVEYGDSLEQQLRGGVLSPLCPLVDVPIMGADSSGKPMNVHEGHIVSAIDEAFPSLPDNARVVNISLGTNVPVTDGRVSLIAQLIDKHARDRDVLVVTTAGNIRDPDLISGFPGSFLSPACRIDSPGDSLIALTVGSIAKFVEAGAISKVNEVSAFSRRGPGPFGGVKPDVVAHGGNCKSDASTSSRIGAHGLMSNGDSWGCDYGTSFAAPLVAAMAAELFDHYTTSSANLIRALLLHFATPVICPSIDLPPTHLAGFGEPNLSPALWANPHAATFLHVGEMAPNTFTFLPFLVPPCLSENGHGRLRIRATITIDPPVDPDNTTEYSKARVSVALRKPTEVGFRRVGISGDVVDGDKWWPVTQLDRRFHRSYASGEWELQVRLWTRNLPNNHRQTYAAVIEVIDDAQKVMVYDEVAQFPGTAFRLVAHRAAA
jgi:hypothetical protein